MSSSRRLLVGLGNPGAEYIGTRHNIGFEVVDAVAAETRIEVRQIQNNAVVGSGRYRGREIVLARPQTFMNLSGLAVRGLMGRHGLMPQDVLVIVDDIALPLGQVRVRQGGSAGGHNGLQDIIDRIGDQFPRLRVGVGNDFSRGRQVDYVLSTLKPNERPIMDEAVASARDAALTFVLEGLITTMNRFNKK